VTQGCACVIPRAQPVGAGRFQPRHLWIHSQGCPSVTPRRRPLMMDCGESSGWKRLVPRILRGALRCRIVTRDPPPATVERREDGEFKGVRASPQVRWGRSALAIHPQAPRVSERHLGDLSSSVTEGLSRGVRPSRVGTSDALHVLSPTVPGLVFPHHGWARHPPNGMIRWGPDVAVCERHFRNDLPGRCSPALRT
jgi:hypothetical protein